MKQKARRIISVASSFCEIYISIIILIGIIVLSFDVIKELNIMAISFWGGESLKLYYKEFFDYSLQLIIGVEFIKMLAKHTPDSAIEVLVFVTAKRLIIDTSLTSVDIFIGVAALAILFGIKKYLNTSILNKENKQENKQ